MSGLFRRSLSRLVQAMKSPSGDGSYCDIGGFELSKTTVDEILNLKDDSFKPLADDLENTMTQIIRSTCREIMTNVIPAILTEYYTPTNLLTLIRHLNEKLKNKYQFNHNIRKIISGLVEGKDQKNLYDERTYRKAQQKLKNLSPEQKKELPKELPGLLTKDLLFISRLLLAINCLDIVYKQLFDMTTTQSENKSKKATMGKRTPDENSELFKERSKNVASGFEIYLDIEPQYVPSFYTFDRDLNKEAQKSKTKAWTSFRNKLDTYLKSEYFGKLPAHDGGTIAVNYDNIKNNQKIPMKALYYLVFKINELYNGLSPSEKNDLKTSKDEEKQQESDNACNMTSSLKKKFVDELDELRKNGNLRVLTDVENARFRFLKLIEMNATNPNKIELLTRATNANPLFKTFDKNNFQAYYDDEKCQTISEEEPSIPSPKKINRQELNPEAQQMAFKLAEELAKKLKPPTDTGTALTEEVIQQQLEKKKKIEEATKEKNKEGKEYINYATIKDEKEFFKTPTKPKSSKFGKKRSYGVSRRRDRSKKRSAKRRTIKKKSIRKKPRAF